VFSSPYLAAVCIRVWPEELRTWKAAAGTDAELAISVMLTWNPRLPT